MIIKKHYCDYCGVELTRDNHPDKQPLIKTVWCFVFGYNIWDENIQGEGCIDCFKSFKEWVKSRKGKGG
jgi:hypothetical protein